MIKSQDRGRQSEDAAVCFYEQQRFQLLARNHEVAGIEVDLILIKNNIYRMVEVKSLRRLDEMPFRLSQKQINRLRYARSLFQDYKGSLVELKILFVTPQKRFYELDIADL